MRYLSIRFLPVITLLFAIAPGLGVAQDPEVDKLELEVSPAVQPRPALKHQLRPRYFEMVEGNAVRYYYRALFIHSELPEDLGNELSKEWDDWMEASMKDLPQKQIETFLSRHDQVFPEIKRASLREDCRWDLGVRDTTGPDFYGILLPEIQNMRALARLVALKARLHVARGEFEAAIDTLKQGYKMGRDGGEQPTLISGLVGLAITNMMDEVMLHLISAPDAPNMYWALRELPSDRIDFTRALQVEMEAPFRVFPFLKDAEKSERTPEEWRRAYGKTFGDLADLTGTFSPEAKHKELVPWGVSILAMKAYPQAKKYLVEERGYTRAEVEAMPVGKAIAVHQADGLLYAYHEMFKLSLLPFDEAAKFDVEKKLADDGYLSSEPFNRHGLLPIASMLLPAVTHVNAAELRSQRTLAALITVEALRMHAAKHGAFPEKLSDLTEAPAARDPLTGDAIAYTLKDGVATLTLQAKPDFHISQTKAYELKLR